MGPSGCSSVSHRSRWADRAGRRTANTSYSPPLNRDDPGGFMSFQRSAALRTALYTYDFRTRQVLPIEDSKGKVNPRLSPDGRYLAALTFDYSKVLLLDFATEKWAELAVHNSFNLMWSRKGDF